MVIQEEGVQNDFAKLVYGDSRTRLPKRFCEATDCDCNDPKVRESGKTPFRMSCPIGLCSDVPLELNFPSFYMAMVHTNLLTFADNRFTFGARRMFFDTRYGLKTCAVIGATFSLWSFMRNVFVTSSRPLDA